MNVKDKLREIVGRHVPGHNDGLISEEIERLLSDAQRAEMEERQQDPLTFDYALERMREALRNAERLAYGGREWDMRVQDLSLLARAWAACADVLDTRNVREKERAEAEEYQAEKERQAAARQAAARAVFGLDAEGPVHPCAD